MSEIIVTLYGSWAEITFNRPDRRNAINLAFVRELRDALVQVNSDTDVRAVIFSGARGVYCSGLDVKEFDPPPPWRAEFVAVWSEVHVQLMDSPKVLIAALEGGAINAGAALAFACDLLVAGRSAFIQVGEMQFGMPIPYNTSWMVLRHGEAIAARFAFLADRVGAEELLRLGIATEVTDDNAVRERAQAIAMRIAGYPAKALAGSKLRLRSSARQVTTAEWLSRAAVPAEDRDFSPKKVT